MVTCIFVSHRADGLCVWCVEISVEKRSSGVEKKDGSPVQSGFLLSDHCLYMGLNH